MARIRLDITDKVIGAFFATYNELSGFPEFVLRRAMAIAIRDAGLTADEESHCLCAASRDVAIREIRVS